MLETGKEATGMADTVEGDRELKNRNVGDKKGEEKHAEEIRKEGTGRWERWENGNRKRMKKTGLNRSERQRGTKQGALGQ